MEAEIKTKKIILFDGECILCNKFVVFIAKNDKYDTFRFLPLKSKNINQFIDSKNIFIKNKESVILISNKKIKYKSSAAIDILTSIGGIYNIYRILHLIPKKLRDHIYNIIANNRYRIFGKTNHCSIIRKKENTIFIKKKLIE